MVWGYSHVKLHTCKNEGDLVRQSCVGLAAQYVDDVAVRLQWPRLHFHWSALLRFGDSSPGRRLSRKEGWVELQPRREEHHRFSKAGEQVLVTREAPKKT